MKLFLLGINHRSASLTLREQFAVEDPKPLLEKLLRGDEIDEAVLLSTCNRVELCAVGSGQVSEMRLHSFFERELAGSDAPHAELEGAIYRYHGDEAARHVLRVTSSIDSMVVGEPQILGQVKTAYRDAGSVGACGSILSRLYQMAFATAKRVKNETAIARRPVSVARVAVELALGVFENLSDKVALLVGAGDTTELALQSLCNAGLAQVRVANRTRGRAAELASRFNASAHGLDELDDLMEEADILLTSIAVREPLFTEELMRKGLAKRRQRPLFVIDIGVPRNVAPEVDAFDFVFRYDVDDLASVAERNAVDRRGEVDRAEAIVDQELAKFQEWRSAQAAVPAIRTLRERAEAIRQEELERYTSRLAASPEQAAQVEALTRGLVNKLLHAPLAKLRTPGEQADSILTAARELFALDEPASERPVTDTEEE